MTMMAFRGHSAGYMNVSAGGLLLLFTDGGNYKLYSWIGTGSSSILANFLSRRPIEVPYNPILHNFVGQDVKFTLKGGFLVSGRTQVGLSIRYSGGNRAGVYNLSASAPDNLIGVDVVGNVVTDFECFGTFRMISRPSPAVVNQIFNPSLPDRLNVATIPAVGTGFIDQLVGTAL